MVPVTIGSIIVENTKNGTDTVKESKIEVIEQALLKNVIGGAGGAGEISSRLIRVECTGK